MRALVYEIDHWVNIRDAPERVNVDKSTIYKWIKTGKVRTFRPLKELWLFIPDLLEAESGSRRGA